MSIDKQGDFFLNFQQFGELRSLARGHSQKAANNIAQQFEGLFVQQMLAAMRSASKFDSDQHSTYMDTYLEMYDKQLAQSIAAQDQLGIAKLILQQLPTNALTTANTQSPEIGDRPRFPPTKIGASSEIAQASETGDRPRLTDVKRDLSPVLEEGVAGGVIVGRVVNDDFAEVGGVEQRHHDWQQPGQFVADIWPQAQVAAVSLGISPRLLVAQAALETGWGKHTMKFDDGRNSYNLFGIKAGSKWHGDSLVRASLEFQDGALQNQLSRFRVYASPTQSLNDYVDFIRSNPRYQPALDQAGSDQAYIREIQRAGYATDPHYADKVISIMNGDLLRDALVALGPGENQHA